MTIRSLSSRWAAEAGIDALVVAACGPKQGWKASWQARRHHSSAVGSGLVIDPLWRAGAAAGGPDTAGVYD